MERKENRRNKIEEIVDRRLTRNTLVLITDIKPILANGEKVRVILCIWASQKRENR